MAKFCFNCGKQLAGNEKICGSCGASQQSEGVSARTGLQGNTTPEEKKESGGENHRRKTDEPGEIFTLPKQEFDYQSINRNLKIKNSQSVVVRGAWWITLAAVLLVILTTLKESPLYGMHLFTFLGGFIALGSLVVALIFRARAKKLSTLISGENVVAAWQLSQEEKAIYSHYLFARERSKNLLILGITTLLIVVIFGLFILFIDEGKGAMLAVMLGLIVILSLFALGMPVFYRQKNLHSDGIILIGRKFAYVNGFFHNWDFPLSGIQKVKPIDKPFYGLYMQYYYVDRTFKNTEELFIPAPPGTDVHNLAMELGQ